MRRWTLAVVLAAGCGGGESPEEAFRAALPPEGLRIAVPGGAAASAGPGVLSQALLGQTAELYALTRRTSDGLNGMVGGILTTIWGIARQPPSAVGPDVAVWGPFTPVLSPATFRLVVERRPDRLVFHLDARPKASGDDVFRPVAAGGPDPAAPPERAAGELSVDFSLLHALDPGHPLEGAMGVRHDLSAGRGSIAVHLQDVAGPGQPPLTADYLYALGPDGTGVFRLAARADLLGGLERLEDGLIVSRWTPSGAGRADAHLQGGDAGAGVNASECWDELFARVWFSAVPAGGTPVEEGDPSRCAFAEPLVPGP